MLALQKMKYIIILVFFTYVNAKCLIDPAYWCDTIEIAEKCGVVTACKERLLQTANAKPVNITLYFESLCPFCKEFFTDQLYPTYQLLKPTGIMVVDIVPYGNAEEVEVSSGFYNYTCQHGPEECTGNFIENCILKYTSYEPDAYLPIIHCMEKTDDPVAVAEKCVVDQKLNWNTVDKCAQGKEGNALMHQSAVLTGALQPPHKYVPWITVNGEHTESMQQSAQEDLLKFVCSTYTGVKPKECFSFPQNVCMRFK